MSVEMSVATMADKHAMNAVALSSPPDSSHDPKMDGSDSELSDAPDDDILDEVTLDPKPIKEESMPDIVPDIPEEEPMEEVVPDYYADDGRVPVFKPTPEQFKDFQGYVSIAQYPQKVSGSLFSR